MCDRQQEFPIRGEEQAYPIMQKLSAATEETIYLAVLDVDQLLYVAMIDSPQMLKCSAAIKVPRWVHFLPELPKTASGKTQRLREMAGK